MKRMAGVFLITFLLFAFTACVMMPLHMAPFVNQTEEVDDDVLVTAVLNQLIQEGVGELVATEVPYKQVLTGEIAVRGDFVSPAKFRRALPDALRSSNKFLVFTRDQHVQGTPMRQIG